MAARTSASTGTLLTISILSIATLGLFVTSVIFFAQRRAALDRAAAADETSKLVVSDRDRNDPVVQRLQSEAQKKKSTLVSYMIDERKQILSRVTGSDRDTLDSLIKTLEDEEVSTNLVSALKDRSAQIATLTRRVADAEAARDRALQDKESEAGRVKDIEQAQRDTIAALTAEVDKIRAEADSMRSQLGAIRSTNDERVERIQGEFTTKEADLRTEIEKLQSERAVNLDRIKTLEGQVRGTRFSGQPEYALIDAQIIAINPAERAVTLSVGRRDKLVLGTTFEVYPQGTTIRPDAATGEYPRGKASLEVIRVDEDSAVARITRELRGNPIVRGDLAANAIYDPTKSYKFLVYGNFDPTGAGAATPQGAAEIKAWIESWGGSVVNELTGDLDFVVLGTRPTLPPEPSSRAPIEVVEEFIRLQGLAKRYDELMRQATAANIPVLNQNRLRTLIGK
jgi:hypothetical protein